MKNTSIMWAVAAIIIGLGIVYLTRSNGTREVSPVSVKVPEFTTQARAGLVKFEANCMRCHGKNAAGTGNGPPFIHKIYEPNHHSDMSFYRAAQFGVRAHHWPYGNMPPVSTVKKGDVTQIIRYVRELQRANGIF